MQHIFLTGFMGSGKSTLGKKLASLLRRSFVDLDKVIEHRENKSISAIFDEEGEAAFREKEALCLRQSVAAHKTAVIALGGGTVCFDSNLAWIKEHGLLVYLELPVAVLASRLQKSPQKRPLLKDLSGDALLEAISQKLDARAPFYNQAHLRVNALNLTPQHLQEAIREATRP